MMPNSVQGGGGAVSKATRDFTVVGTADIVSVIVSVIHVSTMKMLHKRRWQHRVIHGISLSCEAWMSAQ
jgi:hypothetical protein